MLISDAARGPQQHLQAGEALAEARVKGKRHLESPLVEPTVLM